MGHYDGQDDGQNGRQVDGQGNHRLMAKMMAKMQPQPGSPFGECWLLGWKVVRALWRKDAAALTDVSPSPGAMARAEGPSIHFGDDSALLLHPICMQALHSGQGKTCLGKTKFSQKQPQCVHWQQILSTCLYFQSQNHFLVSLLASMAPN